MNKNVNPTTKRKLKINGPSFKKFQNKWKELGSFVDPITREDISFDSPSENLILVGRGLTFFTIESLFEFVEFKKKENEPVTNPVNPSEKISENEIKEVVEKMKKKYPERNLNFSEFVVPCHWILRYHFHKKNGFSFYHLIAYDVIEGVAFEIAFIPEFIDVKDSGETNVTSASVLCNLFQLWEKGFLFDFKKKTKKIVTYSLEDWMTPNGFNFELFKEFAKKNEELL